MNHEEVYDLELGIVKEARTTSYDAVPRFAHATVWKQFGRKLDFYENDDEDYQDDEVLLDADKSEEREKQDKVNQVTTDGKEEC